MTITRLTDRTSLTLALLCAIWKMVRDAGQGGGQLRSSRVSVVESAEVRNRDDLAGAVFDRAWRWRVATETQVSARLVVERGDRLPPIARF